MLRRRLLASALALPLALGGCGRSTDVGAFLEQAESPQEEAILRSIATYRTTEDDVRACTLVTDSFIDGRFEGEADNCQQVLRTASRHLPHKADVQTVNGNEARVFVDEPTATRSYYEMRREGGEWKIDDIVEAP